MNNGAKATPYESTLPYESSLNSTGFDTNSSIPSNFSIDSFAFLTPLDIPIFNPLTPFAIFLPCVRPLESFITNCLAPAFNLSEESFILFTPHF